ncbi:hypothetical protein BASA62_001597 [Batrachochytrium salamandrivorans]|nr:hypothetical protein BASA62_001597 [Batrachochytrium salamandrivorans]
MACHNIQSIVSDAVLGTFAARFRGLPYGELHSILLPMDHHSSDAALDINLQTSSTGSSLPPRSPWRETPPLIIWLKGTEKLHDGLFTKWVQSPYMRNWSCIPTPTRGTSTTPCLVDNLLVLGLVLCTLMLGLFNGSQEQTPARPDTRVYGHQIFCDRCYLAANLNNPRQNARNGPQSSWSKNRSALVPPTSI